MLDYVELHLRTCYSLLASPSRPEEYVSRGVDLGMSAMAVTDRDAVYGAVEFAQVAKERGIKPIHGAELTLENGHQLVLLVETDAGWPNLCWLISQGRANAPKGQSILPEHLLEGHTDGLIALSGGRSGRVSSALLNKDWGVAHAAASRYRDLFGTNRFYIELQNHLLPKTDLLNRKLVALSQQLNTPYVATNHVHYVQREDHRLQDVLVSIDHNRSLDQTRRQRLRNAEYYLKSIREMGTLFAPYPEALANTVRIAERCNFTLKFGLQALPEFPVPDSHTAETFLRDLCITTLRERGLNDSTKALDQLERELRMIAQAGLANYFLIVWDIVRYARENDILCQGRGSAANSLVAYLLSISPINPLAHDLVFERFLSEERQTAPDIDIDFQADRREEVIQYVYSRYGREYAAMACTHVTFRSRSAARDLGKALGMSPEVVNTLATAIRARNPADASLFQHPRLDTKPITIPIFYQALYERLHGLTDHLGLTNGGMVVAGQPISTLVPTEPATMPGRTVLQWNKDALEDVGLIKIDILGLRMLSLIAEARRHIEKITGQKLDLSKLTMDDPAVYEMIQRADTIGVFQVESRAQAQVLPRMRPSTFNDLIICISLIRPGPVQGNMVHPYLRRHSGEEKVYYDHPLLEKILGETKKVILWQEQVLKLARDIGGMTAGEGEQLRRVLAKNDKTAVERYKVKFMAGAKSRGISQSVAGDIFRQIENFAGYSFPKSHAAAFAVLVYQSAWLKFHYPAAFYTALLNNQPMGFWSPAVIVNDIKRHGIRVLPVSAHRSEAKCTIEGNAIRLGFKYVNGIGDEAADRILQARHKGAFIDLTDFCYRTQLPRLLTERLIMVGGMDGWGGGTRRQRLWQLGEIYYHPNGLPLRAVPIEVELPPQSRTEALADEFAILGLTTGDHLMTLYREQLERQHILGSADLAGLQNETQVTIAGLVVMHQAPPPANGVHFVTLEDENGFLNIVCRPDVYERYERQIVESPILVISGVVQRKGDVINIVARKVEALELDRVAA